MCEQVVIYKLKNNISGHLESRSTGRQLQG